VLFVDFARPDRVYVPAEILKRRLDSLVTSDVFVELLLPEIRIGRRVRREAASLVTMPEASVDEHHRAKSRQDNVWLTRQASARESETKSGTMKETAYRKLRFRIASPDTRHHPASSSCVDDVDHQFYRAIFNVTAEQVGPALERSVRRFAVS
jgi:hypothetical protein